MLCSPHEIPQLKYLTQLVVYFIYKKQLTLQHSPHFPTPRTCPMQMLSVCQKPGKKSHVTVANHWKYDAGKQQIVSLFCNSSTAALCLTASSSTATTRTTGTKTRGNNNVGVSLGKCTNPGSNGWHMVCLSCLCHYSWGYRWQSGGLINVVNVSNWYIHTRPQVEAHFYLIFLTPSRYLAIPLTCPLSRPLSLSYYLFLFLAGANKSTSSATAAVASTPSTTPAAAPACATKGCLQRLPEHCVCAHRRPRPTYRWLAASCARAHPTHESESFADGSRSLC